MPVNLLKNKVALRSDLAFDFWKTFLYVVVAMKKKVKITKEEQIRKLMYRKLARVELLMIEIKELAKSLQLPVK